MGPHAPAFRAACSSRDEGALGRLAASASLLEGRAVARSAPGGGAEGAARGVPNTDPRNPRGPPR
eukprot:953980-Pyramimonas_sp.AAC.1